jgi:3-methylcrotonyl-CoA carboxylase alpha subunit
VKETTVTVGSEEFRVAVERKGDVFHVARGEQVDEIEIVRIDASTAVLRVNGRLRPVPYLLENDTVEFIYGGESFRAEIAGEGGRRKRGQKEHSMAAPMPGAVVRIFVETGAHVEKGAPLIVLEAMKMEHQIIAPHTGTVRAIHCREGELVQPGLDLIELEAEAEG